MAHVPLRDLHEMVVIPTTLHGIQIGRHFSSDIYFVYPISINNNVSPLDATSEINITDEISNHPNKNTTLRVEVSCVEGIFHIFFRYHLLNQRKTLFS